MHPLIIDNFDSFTYNLFQEISEISKKKVDVFLNNQITIHDILQRKYTHIIISPGPGSPENPSDIGICREAIDQLKDKIPILGVCLGHQAIIHAFGGKIIRAPEPVHGKTSKVTLNTKAILFQNLPPEIEVMRYHSLVADPKTFPTALEITAKTNELIMAFQHHLYPLHGIQFHPESFATPQGKEILKNFLDI